MFRSIRQRIRTFIERPLTVNVIIFFLAVTMGIALGFIWRGQTQQAPIIIEKYSP